MSTTRNILYAAASAAAALIAASATAETVPASSAQSLARGKYIAQIGGCNDCHTPGYAMTGGKVPEKDWLTGDALGFRGDWGTTYPSNLRTFMQALTEAQWVKAAKTLQTRPPMPWFNVNALSDGDLRAFYRYVRSLGHAGTPAGLRAAR